MPALPQEEQLQKTRPAPQQGQVPTATPDPQVDAMQQLFGQKAQAPTQAPAQAPVQAPAVARPQATAQAPTPAQPPTQTPQPQAQQPAPAVDWQSALPGIAQKYGIQPDLIQRVIKAESAGNIKALSPKGAMGLMQLMPLTAKGLGVDPSDPLQNLDGGTRELKRLLDKYQGHYGRALAAYNAGEAAVDRTQHFEELPAETQAYVHGIMQGYRPPGASKTQQTQQPGQGPQGPQASHGLMDFGRGLLGQQTPGTYPEGVSRALLGAEKYLVTPFEKMAQAGAQEGRSLGREALTMLARPSEGTTAQTQEAVAQQHPLAMGAAGAVGSTAGGAAVDPRNWPFFASGMARPILQRLISGGFGVQMSHGAVEGAMQLYHNWDQMTPEQRSEVATQTGLTTVFAALSGEHALSGGGARASTSPKDVKISDTGRERVQTSPTTRQAEPAGVQVAPRQEPSVAQEGGPTPVTQTGITAAREVTGGRVPAQVSAPIEGPLGSTGRITAKPSGSISEERRGPGAQQPYTGPERRLTDVAREQMFAAGQGRTPGQQLEATMRQGLPAPNVSEGDVWRYITTRGAREPAWYQQWTQQYSAADTKTQGTMLKSIQKEILDAKPSSEPNAQGSSGLPQAPAPTPAQSSAQSLSESRPAAQPARAPGQPLQPQQEPVRQPLQQVSESKAPERPVYKTLPAAERPRVSVGGRVEARPTALEQTLEGLKKPAPAERAPAEIQPGVQATPRPKLASGEQLESWKQTRRAEATTRQEAMKQEAVYKPKIETRSPVGAALDRYLKPPGAYKGDRGAELVKAVEDVKKQGPEAVQKTSEELLNRATRANNMAEWGQRHLEGRETDEMATERLHAGHMAERGVPEALGQWAESKGFKWSQAPEWRREITSSKAEALNRLRGNQLKEVGEQRERTPEENTQLKTLEDARDRLVTELRKQSRPTERALEQLDTLIVNIQALKGTRFVAESGPKTLVGERGELLPTGTRATSEMLNRFMGRPEGSHGAKPSQEDIEARVRELQKEGQWASNLAKELGAPAKATETRPTEVEAKVKAPPARPTAPKVPEPVERPTEAPKAAPTPATEPKVTPASELFARQSEELQSQRQHLANIINKGYGDTQQASNLRKTIKRIEGTLGLKAPEAPSGVKATLEGQSLLREAQKALPKPEPEKAIYAPETVKSTPSETLHELLKGYEHSTPLVDKWLTANEKGRTPLGAAADYITRPILDALKKGDLTAGEAGHRLNRALEVFAEGRKKAGTLAEGKASGMAKAFNDAVRIAKEGRLPAPKTREAGILQLGGRKTGPSLMDRIKRASDDFKKSRVLEEGLTEMDFQRQADIERFKQGLKDLQKVSTPQEQQAMYRQAERATPGTQAQFTTKQQNVYDNHIRDWVDQAEQDYHYLKGQGHDVENYVRRVAIRKNTMWDRISKGSGQYTLGSVLRQTASSMKGRSFFKLDFAGAPADLIAHVDDKDRVTIWNNQKPLPTGLTREQMQANGMQFKTATTDSIEKHSGQEYLQHMYVAAATNALELRSAVRASDFLEAYKQSPEFKTQATKLTSSGAVPDGFSTTKVPQLQGYAFEKHTAEVLDKYYERLNKKDASWLENFNDFLTTTIYWNPLKHGRNVLDHWATHHGLSTFLNPTQYRPMVKGMIRAVKAVWNGNNDYLYAWDNGMPLRGRATTGRQLTKSILSELNRTGQGTSMAKAWGYANPVQMYHRILDFNRKTLFGFDDILRLQATYHHMDTTGSTFHAAWKDVSKHLPDYTVPTHVGIRIPGTQLDVPSKGLASAFSSRALMFGRYHFGRLKSYGEMAHDLLSKDTPLKERAKAMDRLFMVALSMMAYSTLGKMAAQKITGRQDAEMAPSGATAVPWQIMRLAQGKTSIGRAATQTFTPSPAVELGGRMVYGELSRPKPLGQQLKEAGGGLLKEIGPVREASQAKTGTGGQVDAFEVARRAFLNIYTPRAPKGGAALRGLPRMPHFPRNPR